MTTSSTEMRPHPDRGQATVEFALVLPIVVVIALGLLQVGIAIRNEVVVELAAREGARAASVAANPGAAAARAAHRAVDLPLSVSTSSRSTTVSVTVTYVDPSTVPIIGGLIGPTTHRATVTMAFEPP